MSRRVLFFGWLAVGACAQQASSSGDDGARVSASNPDTGAEVSDGSPPPVSSPSAAALGTPSTPPAPNDTSATGVAGSGGVPPEPSGVATAPTAATESSTPGSGDGGSPSRGGTGHLGAGGAIGGAATPPGGAGNGAAGEPIADGGSGPLGPPGVSVQGPDLVLDGDPFHIRGVAWNPVPRGQTHPAGLDYAGAASVDIPLMQSAGINAVRTYEPLLDRVVLDQLYAAGIYVLNSVYPYGGDAAGVVTERVNQVKDHPAILLWLLGNEWNYNGLYVDLPQAEAMARLNEAAALVRAADPDHPIATVYGELPDPQVIDAMPEIDLWGINSYRGLSFGALFDDWTARSPKPMFVAEYGADAYNANIAGIDLDSHAEAVAALTREIAQRSRAFGDGPAVGGALFEWADEWWKDAGGSPDVQDVGGIAPGGGPHPDATFNEEWWGIVDIDRNARPAYDALGEVFLELSGR